MAESTGAVESMVIADPGELEGELYPLLPWFCCKLSEDLMRGFNVNVGLRELIHIRFKGRNNGEYN